MRRFIAVSSTVAAVGILRPRMGIGGAERLIADAAIALMERGHTLTLHAPERADTPQFPELEERAVPFDRSGGWIPSTLGGRLRLPLSIARAVYAGVRLSRTSPDVVICDSVPHILPLLRRITKAPALYYCHFPDVLLTADGSRDSAPYRRYRAPLDRMENTGLASADVVATNSRFTSSIVQATFPAMQGREILVLYPGVRVSDTVPPPPSDSGLIEIVSVARFDPRKNLQLAIDALSVLRSRLSPALYSRLRLILAGHHDAGLAECVSLVDHLTRRIADLDLTAQISFEFSPSESARHALLRRARCVIYTPLAEHFGYVPVEAMAAARPVVAVNRGGPTETVVNGSTGFLAAPSPEDFAEALAPLLERADLAAQYGANGYERARGYFSLRAFGDRLADVVSGMLPRHGGTQ